MRNSQLHIILAETSPIIRTGIVQLLTMSGMHVKWFQAESLAEVQRFIKMEVISLVIINPNLVINQEKNMQSLRIENEDVKWLALVYSVFDSSLLGMFDSVVHITDSSEVITAQIQRSFDEDKMDEPASKQSLSEREIDVLKLLVTGFSNKEIADKLAISTHTVITHRKNISQKTGIKSVSGLTIFAVVKGIISLNNVPE